MKPIRRTPKEREEAVHASVALYLKIKYPKAIFNTDLSGIKLTMNQAIKAKNLRSSRAFPDLVIYEPRRGFYGLFLELKRTGEKIHRRDGTIRADQHLQEQSEMLQALETRGYCARFAIGYTEAKTIIDWYFNEK